MTTKTITCHYCDGCSDDSPCLGKVTFKRLHTLKWHSPKSWAAWVVYAKWGGDCDNESSWYWIGFNYRYELTTRIWEWLGRPEKSRVIDFARKMITPERHA